MAGIFNWTVAIGPDVLKSRLQTGEYYCYCGNYTFTEVPKFCCQSDYIDLTGLTLYLFLNAVAVPFRSVTQCLSSQMWFLGLLMLIWQRHLEANITIGKVAAHNF